MSRQALVRVDGAQYSVPSHWSGSQATAYVGVADIVLEWREERITVAKRARGSRTVKYKHYLDELAKKPQAVRQVAPELMAELGAPYEQPVAVAEHPLRGAGGGTGGGQAESAPALSMASNWWPRRSAKRLRRCRRRTGRAGHPRRCRYRRRCSCYQGESTPAATYDALLLGSD